MQWLLLIIIIPYIYLLLKIYRNLLKIKPYHSGTDTELFLSVIVACRNEETNLPALLSDISAQVYNNNLFELIIIDDHSSDRTFLLASEFRGIKNLRVLENSGKGKKLAIRTGVEACRGDLIITTDADCRIGNSWLKTIVSFYNENKSGLIICPVKMDSHRGFFHKFQELEFLSLQGVTAGTAVAEKPVMCNGANLAFTKEIYYKHIENLHDEMVSGDDIFLLHSIKKEAVSKICWLESQEATLTTLSAENINSFLKQRSRWISKAGIYNDRFTKILAIVSFSTIFLQIVTLVAGIFDTDFLMIFFAIFLIKSVPDFLILQNTASRYGKNNIMRWFLPSEIIYPFYVMSVVISLFIPGFNPRL
jgi:glycosyltransferase involved in cell wall biosynthesis